jgi:integrase
LSPAWDELFRALQQEEDRARMRGFFCWCSDFGIQPDEVDDQVLAGYADYRSNETIRTHVGPLVSSIRRFWNRAVEAGLPGWPSRLLTAPPKRNVDALPLSSFPKSFQTELAAYLSKRMCPDPFDADHAAWRPTTAASVRCCLIRAASVIARRLGGPQHVKSLADIATIDAVEFVLRHIFERSGNKWRGHAGNYANYLLGVAREFVRVDTPAAARIEELRNIIAKRLREQRKPGLSERVSERLMPFDDPLLVRRLFQLPGQLYRIAASLLNAEPPKPVRAAQIHEQGLMLGVLQVDPMRRYNIATICFDDFVRDDRNRIIRLRISGQRVKNGIIIDTPIPVDLAKRIQIHAATYRPHLRGSNSPWLFPSPSGKARTPDNVTKTIGRIVSRMLGIRFTPHMARHILATRLYRRSPHNGVVVQRLLRHVNVKVTERMYGVMSNAGASAEWQREVDQLRRARASSKRGNRRNG